MCAEPRGRGARSGLTLVEAAVALVILSMTVAAEMESTARALRAQHDAERHRVAAVVAEWKMNQLASLTADSLREYTLVRGGQVPLDGTDYGWQATARPHPGSPRLWEVAVGVDWDGGRVMLETLLYRRSPPGSAAP